MRQRTKISGIRAILISSVITGAICMPITLYSQPSSLKKDWVVVIDAGHGDQDPGSIGISRTKEKNITLAIALKTGSYIRENLKDTKVIFTRDDDTFLGLDERAEVANKNKADIFISIHANAIDDKRPTGAETWVLGQSMDDANLKVAMKENSVITFEEDYQTKYEGYDPNSVESFIIFSLMQNTYLKQSTEFASMIQDQFRDRVGRKDRGVKQAGFVVLWRTTMPSVLVEVGFITNAEEEKYLVSEEGQEYIASGIYRAFREYKQTIDSRSGMAQSTGSGANNQKPAVKVEESSSVPSAPLPAGTTGNSSGNQSSNQIVKQGTETASKPLPNQPQSEAKNKPAGDIIQKQQNKSTLAGDLWYTVQIAALPKKNSSNKQASFKGVESVTRIDAGDRYKYGAGKFSVYEDAVNYRRSISVSFPDAFVIAVKEGRIISLMEAIKEEKQTKD